MKIRSLLNWRNGRRLFSLLTLLGVTSAFFCKTPLLPPQLAPAVESFRLGGLASGIPLFILLLTTLLLGRVYCASLCPLGIIQDIFYNPKPLRRYRVPLRWITLGIWGVSIAIGDFLLMRFLDPYSIFGSMLVGNSLVIILFFALLALGGHRYWCRELCPVGAGLELLSRRVLFNLALQQSQCISCGICSKNCPVGAIDLANKLIDSGRCIRCLNCITQCPRGAIGWNLIWNSSDSIVTDSYRRKFLSGLANVAGGVALGGIATAFYKGEKAIIAPPGASDLDKFLSSCTGCGLCLNNCQGDALTFQKGVAALDFSKGMCEYSCNNCSQVCPTGALKPLPMEVKRRTAIGKARFYPNRCVAVQDGTDCGACAEHCPTGALRMFPNAKGQRVPELELALCIGCGNCERPCPVRPDRAIVVEPLSKHELAADPEIWFREHKPKVEEDVGNSSDGEWLL